MEHSLQVEQVQKCFEKGGYETSMVDSFSKAIELLKTKNFDLIISDVHLENGGSVFDFLKWARKNFVCKSTPFVLYSLEPSPTAKYLADGVRMAAKVLGAQKYISMENFDSHRLLSEMAELLPTLRPSAAASRKRSTFKESSLRV